MQVSIGRFFALCITLCLGLANFASAHEIRPAIADLYLQGGEFRLEITLNLEAVVAEIGAEEGDTSDSDNVALYDRLRGSDPAALDGAFNREAFARNITVLLDEALGEAIVSAVEIPEIGDIDLSRNSVVTITGSLGDAQEFRVGWAEEYGQIIIRLMDGEVDFDTFLTAGTLSEPIPITGGVAQSFGAVFVNYVAVGFDHIVPKGLDHILFVVGLFLLSTRLHPLLWQITAFTLAHSVTLALGILGIVAVPASIVEPLIAASIVY
ncbi:MAG: HupE/UreJ family protein, partial [Rhodobacteraceae bacterium]|nr:HupE/UreJ family protein [Paracoccaceae bacterium]